MKNRIRDMAAAFGISQNDAASMLEDLNARRINRLEAFGITWPVIVERILEVIDEKTKGAAEKIEEE